MKVFTCTCVLPLHVVQVDPWMRASITHTLGVYTVQDIVKYSLYISTAHNDVINVLCKHLFIKIIHERKIEKWKLWYRVLGLLFINHFDLLSTHSYFTIKPLPPQNWLALKKKTAQSFLFWHIKHYSTVTVLLLK